MKEKLLYKTNLILKASTLIQEKESELLKIAINKIDYLIQEGFKVLL